MENRSDLSIIIVSWNVQKYIEKCLKSIYQANHSITFEVIVVDNASKDNTVSFIKENYPQLKLIVNQKNRGFAGASNQGLSEARGRYVLLLNPDTVVLKDSLKNSIDYLDQNPKIGVLGCKILNPDLTLQPSARKFPTFKSQLVIMLKLHYLFPNLKSVREYAMLDWPHDKIAEVDQVMGAFFMIRNDLVRQIGELDEGFFLWFEEVDYCRRLKNLGYQVVFYPEAQIIHYKAQSFEQLKSVKRNFQFNKSLLHYFKKYHKRWEYLLLYFLQPISWLLSFFVQILEILRIPFKKSKEV